MGSFCGANQISYNMQVFTKPYNHLIAENYMTEPEFARCKDSIIFDEIKEYCADPSVHEHNNALHGNYSMPVDETKSAGWMFDYFANDQTFDAVTEKLYGRVLKADHCYINLHWDSADTDLGIHNDQKKYRWLVTGQLYVKGSPNDGVILQDDDLNEIAQVPLKPNLFYAMATSMYSWHHVKSVSEDKVSILVRFGKKQINTVTNPADEDYAIIILNEGHFDGHYSKLGMRMANMTEAWLSNQGYKNIHMTEWKNPQSVSALRTYCDRHYKKVIEVPSGYLGNKKLLANEEVQSSDIEYITKDNIKERADVIFDRSTYNNTRFRAGEIILKNFNPLANFSSTKEVVLK